ncbi:MAG TPA: hypothetical protein VN493_14590 [Thermoanaerobaculia bacterium]|nr:hypothetical protein [Thermoanaerobaculia bacterium]
MTGLPRYAAGLKPFVDELRREAELDTEPEQAVEELRRSADLVLELVSGLFLAVAQPLVLVLEDPRKGRGRARAPGG